MTNGIERRTKVFYMIISVLISIGLWAYVSYIEDDTVTGVRFSGIKINFTNEELVNDNNLVITDIDIDSVDLTYSGRYNTLMRMSSSDITATVDLSKILNSSTAAGVYTIPIDIAYNSSSINTNNITITSYSSRYVSVTVEKMSKRNISVRAFFQGQVADGYMADQPKASEDTITVYGSQDTLSSIDYASVTLSRDNISRSVSELVDVVLIDQNGDVMDTSGLQLSADELTVSVTVTMRKEIALEINLVESNSATSANTKVDISPSSIEVSGDPDVLEALNSITLGTIDLSSFVSTFKDTYQITIPNDVSNLSGITSATVNVEVYNVESTRLSVNNVSAINTDGFVYVSLITQSMDVTVRGESSDVKKVTAENIRIVADLSDIDRSTTGTIAVPAKVYIDGYTNLDAIGDYTLGVVISNTVPEQETEEENIDTEADLS